MNKETYLKLPNITVGELQDIVNYLEENNIKYIEYYENEHKLENALDEIECDRAIEFCVGTIPRRWPSSCGSI